MNATTLISSVVVLLTAPTGWTASPEMPPIVLDRGAHHRTFGHVVEHRTPDGRAFYRTNRTFIELASNLHYQKDGQWIETKEEFELFEDGAIARNGPHQVILAPNVNTTGAVDFLTPEGLRMRSHVVGLAYYEKTTGRSVWVALIKDCIGGLVPPNRVIYRDAFEGITADVQYTYRKSGFEQDIILLERVESPAAYGLDPDASYLEIVTEFIEAPEPTKTVRQLHAGRDEELHFGSSVIGAGGAFIIDGGDTDRGPGIAVNKAWIPGERTYLTESLSYRQLRRLTAALPDPQAAAAAKQILIGKVQPARVFPDLKSGRGESLQARSEKIMLTAAPPKRRAVLWDYQTLTGSLTNFTFTNAYTYLISGGLTLRGTNIFEGGCVLKFTNGASAGINVDGGAKIIWKSGPYSPVICTARDDNSVGETLPGSTGNAETNGFYAGTAFNFFGSVADPIQYLRVSYASTAVWFSEINATLRNCQFIRCNKGIVNDYADMIVENVLMHRVAHAFYGAADLRVRGSHLTYHEGYYLGYMEEDESTHGAFYLTNSLFIRASNWVSSVNMHTNFCFRGSDSSVFQSVGAGSHYLAANSQFRDSGSANVSADVRNSRRFQSTFPPTILSNIITSSTTFNPQAQRDTDVPDLGYAYDAIDFAVNTLPITNATVILTNGVIFATYGDSGLWLQDNSILVSEGTPLNRNRICSYSTVQERATNWGNATSHIAVNPYHYGVNPANGLFRFTTFNFMSGGGHAFYMALDPWRFRSLGLRDCEFINGSIEFAGATNDTIALTNNLFWGTYVNWALSSPTIWAHNNLFHSPYMLFFKLDAVNTWTFKDNLFDGVTVDDWGYTTTNTHNAYLNCVNRLNPGTDTNDIVSGAQTFHSGLLGHFYQPTNSALTNKGSQLASAAMLYHYTVHTNQVRETNSIVDVGYHYVALNGNNEPFDFDSDGLPDWQEDWDGGGSLTSQETDWQDSDSDNDGVSDYLERLQGRNPLASGTVADTNAVVNFRVYTPLK